MPCQPCEDDGNIAADREHVFLRFIGGEDKVGKLRGRWRTYETGRIYRRFPSNANFEAYPYWAPATEKEFCDQVKARAKAEEEAVDSTSSEQDDVTLSAELPKEEIVVSPNIPETSEPIIESSDGLREELGGGISEEALIRGMEDALLKTYIVGNGGKVDGRWGREKLVQEALKL